MLYFSVRPSFKYLSYEQMGRLYEAILDYGEYGTQISHEDRVLCSVVQQTAAAAKDGSREMAIFDSAVSAAAYGLGKDYDHATNMHKHIPGWLDGFTDQIQNLPVTPAEISGAAGDGAGNGGGEE